jgi:hypothetical protein
LVIVRACRLQRQQWYGTPRIEYSYVHHHSSVDDDTASLPFMVYIVQDVSMLCGDSKFQISLGKFESSKFNTHKKQPKRTVVFIIMPTNNNTMTAPSSKPTMSGHTTPPFSGPILEQVLQFVLPADVARVSMVCKTWRDELEPQQQQQQLRLSINQEDTNDSTGGSATNSTAIWKQAVMNRHPNVMQAVIAAASSSGGETGGGDRATLQQIDFHALAKSDLGRKCKKAKLPEPTFRFEDLIIVLELKQKKKVVQELENGGEEQESIESVGTFWKNGSSIKDDILDTIHFDLPSVPEIIFEGKNPLCPETYSGDEEGRFKWERAKDEFRDKLSYMVMDANGDPFWFLNLDASPITLAATKAHKQLLVSVTLFRRDDWRSFCLLEDVEVTTNSSSYGDRLSLSFESGQHWAWGCRRHDQWSEPSTTNIVSLRPFVRNGPGSVAYEILESKGIRTMMAAVFN